MDKNSSNDINYLIEYNIINSEENNELDAKVTIPESLTTNCFLCRTKLTSFLTRSHRCYVCLKYFCHSCQIKIKKKHYCKECYKLCKQLNEIIGKHFIKITENKTDFVEMRETFYCKNFDSYQFSFKNILNDNNNIYEHQLLVKINDTYELIIKTFINYVLKINFHDETIVNEWKNIIYILIKETISNLRPCSRYLNDTLDINNFIKIKLIPYKDNSMCQVIQGYVLDKKKNGYNVKDTIYNPRILLLKTEINNNEEEKTNVNNANNNKNDNNIKDFEIYLSNFISYKIDIIKPDIIIFGKYFPKEKIDIIKNNFNNISIICDVDNEEMNKLSRCFQTLILPSIKFIGNNYILGSCKKFYVQNFSDNNNNKEKRDTKENEDNNNIDKKDTKENENNNINENVNQQNNNLYIFDGCSRLLFNTILLSGNDMDLLKKLKQLLRQILLPSIRDLFLQKYIQYILNMEINSLPQEAEIEEDFIEELYEESNEIVPLKTERLSLFNKKGKEKEKKSQKTLMKRGTSEKTDITQSFYEGFDLSIIEKKENFNIYSLISLSSSQKAEAKINLKEEKEEEISEKAIHSIVNKYCEDAKELNFSFFNGNENYDQSLGKFILYLCKKSNTNCPTCHLEYKKHTLYLFRAKGVLKLWMISEDENDLGKIINYLNNKTNVDYRKLLIYKNDIYSTNEMMNTDIYTYGYCNICKGIVTPLFKMSNETFNYSASKFLRFMLENHLSRNQTRNYEYNISNIIVNNNCEHQVNKDICRIFVTRFGSWKLEYNDIIKHYITPMNFNINDYDNSFSQNIMFKQYEEEGFSNCANTVSIIQKALISQENFFNKLLEDKKLYLFKDHINSLINIIRSVHNFNAQCITELINRHLKKNLGQYNNSYVRLISVIKKIYLCIVKIKLIANRIERMKINIKIISDILNNKIPITLEETNKSKENLPTKDKKNNETNDLEEPLSENNFGKDTSFRNILTFINYYDNDHDNYSCEFIQDDLSSFIGNIISSNEYMKYMELKSGINLTSIKNNKKPNDKIDNIIEFNLLKKRKFSSYKQVQEKKFFFGEIDKGLKRKMSLDDNKDISELFDTLLIFDQSKQNFYVEGDDSNNFSNNAIKKILEEELTSGEKGHKTFYLSNDLYSLLIKNRKKDDEPKINKSTSNEINLSDNKSNNNNFRMRSKSNYINNIFSSDNNIINLNDKFNDDVGGSCKNLSKVEKFDVKLKISRKTSKNDIQKDYSKITEYFKEIDKLIFDANENFKIIRDNLNDIINKQIDNNKKEKEKEKKKTKETEKKETKEKDKEKEKDKDMNKDKDENNETNSENNNNKSNEKKSDNNSDDGNNILEKNELNPEENIPLFSVLPEFEKIANQKRHVFFEEKLILKEPNDIEIIVYYAKKFEALRISYCASLEDFLSSLNKSKEWSDNTGGKSKASFYKTFDEKYILKSVNENEFNMFLDKGLEYFRYLSQFLFHKMPSALAKILGAYKIIIKQKNKDIKYHLLLMENIYYGMMSQGNSTTFNTPESNIRVYDLKGSNVNRYIHINKRKPRQVLLDTNFLVDFNKEPVFIDSNVYDRLKLALYNDTNYLKSLGVVDYSFLIIFNDKEKGNGVKHDKCYHKDDNNNNTNNNGAIKQLNGDINHYRLIKFGIIDYTRKYTWDKKMEFYGKSLLYGENPTIVDPNVYSERFYKRISRYFVGV